MAITKEEIIEALHSGVRNAIDNCHEWSDGVTNLAKSPEYLIVVEIARSIYPELGGSECLRLETPYREVLEGSGIVKGPGAPLKAIKGGKKADLALLKNRDKPTCVIEVKKNPTVADLMRDLERLRDVVYACRNKKGVLKHGFLSIYESRDYTDRDVDTIDQFFRANRHRARAKRPCTKTWQDEHTSGEHTSIVVEITAIRDS